MYMVSWWLKTELWNIFRQMSRAYSMDKASFSFLQWVADITLGGDCVKLTRTELMGMQRLFLTAKLSFPESHIQCSKNPSYKPSWNFYRTLKGHSELENPQLWSKDIRNYRSAFSISSPLSYICTILTHLRMVFPCSRIDRQDARRAETRNKGDATNRTLAHICLRPWLFLSLFHPFT